MRRERIAPTTAVIALTAILTIGPAMTALACGGLVAPNGTINLLKTTTLAAYHRGIEHYVTSFEFAGEGAAEVGSIVPLPGVPTRVVKAGGWTLQRLVEEVTPPPPERETGDFAAATAAPSAQVLLEAQIDALDITVLKGGAVAVGAWAKEHGFFLPPDAPEVLEFYAERSPIFMAARFNAGRAEEQGVRTGEGTPIHVAIPTPNPWVPLRILGLGRQEGERIQADVFLLTDSPPSTLPQAEHPSGDLDQRGLIQEVSEPASPSLLRDLRSDDRMLWLPRSDLWLTYIRVNEEAGRLTHDLAIDASGYGQPDPVAAGFARRLISAPTDDPTTRETLAVLALLVGTAFSAGWIAKRRRAGVALMRQTPRSVMSVAILLASVVAVPACGSAHAAEDLRTVHITIHHSAFDPNEIYVAPGETVRFVVENTDPIDHEFLVGNEQVQAVHERGTEARHAPKPGEMSVPALTTRVTTYTFPTGHGSTIFGCHLPGHYAYGMRGAIRFG